MQLATYQTLFGDWRELFHEVEQIDKVTPADIRASPTPRSCRPTAPRP